MFFVANPRIVLGSGIYPRMFLCSGVYGSSVPKSKRSNYSWTDCGAVLKF